MAVGSRRLISQEAAAKWRKAREAAADQATEVRGNGVTVSPSRSPATWSSIRPPRCAARPDGARPRVHRLRHRPSQGGPNRRLTPLSARPPRRLATESGRQSPNQNRSQSWQTKLQSLSLP
jgi:hypothetical protein